MIESHFLTSSHMQVHTILHLLAKIQKKISKNQESICPKFATFRSMSHFYYIDSKLRVKTSKDMVGTIYLAKQK